VREERVQQEAERNKQKLLKKRNQPPVENESSSGNDASGPVEPKKRPTATDENVTPPRADQPTNGTANERKYLHILKKATTFTEEPMTPPRIVSGFRESPLTPTPKNFRVEDMTPVARSRKRKVAEYLEPSNVLPKPKWLVKDDAVAATSKRAKLTQEIGNGGGSTQFRVHKLLNKNRRKRAADLIPQELIAFRNRNMQGNNVPRVDSKTLSRQREARTVTN